MNTKPTNSARRAAPIPRSVPFQRMNTPPKDAARRLLGLQSGYTPRTRAPGEATPPAMDLMQRQQYRPGIDNACRQMRAVVCGGVR